MTTQEERDEDLAFNQAFEATKAGTAGEQGKEVAEPAPPPQSAETTAEAPAVDKPAESAKEEADPFASLPPAVRDLLATIPALRAEQEQLRRMANMVPALQSRIDKMSQPAAAESPSVPAKSRFAKVEALRNELPEIADALDEIANAQHQAPAATRPEPRQQDAAQPQATPEERTLTLARPTWADDLTSSDFQLWLVRQPREFQAQVQQTSEPGEILAALGKFDASKAQTTNAQQLNQTRTTRMAAAVTPQGDGRRQSRAAAPDDEEEAAFTAAFNKRRGR